MSLSLDSALTVIGGVVKAIGYVGVIGASYVAIGLPLPATVEYVDHSIGAISTSLFDLRQTVLEGQLRDIVAQRNFLRNEETTIRRSLDLIDDSAKAVLLLRLGEIQDTLKTLDRQEVEVRQKLKRVSS
ncbi:hypothetical protein [Amorphus sp. MBR-141]